jgi:hypothetical protein
LAVGLPVDPVFFETPTARREPSVWLQGLKYGLGAGFLVALGYGVALMQASGQPRVRPVLEHSSQPATAQVERSAPPAQLTTANLPPIAAPVSAMAPSTLASTVPRAAAAFDVAPSVAAPLDDAAARSGADRRTVSARRAARKWRSKARASKVAALTRPNDASETVARDNGARSDVAKQTEAALPARPNRDAVKAAIEVMKPALHACVGDAHGLSQATLTITGDGRVIYSRIEGAFVGTPEGSCMARTLRKASFPAFAGESFRLRYPLLF